MISAISQNRQKQNPSFGRALSEKELKHFREIYSKSQKALNKTLGIEKDSKVFIMPDFSMPDIDHENTGMGRFFSDETPKFAKLVKDYFQADAIQTLPQNRNFRVKAETNYFSPYSCDASMLGEQTINLKALTTKEYGGIITKQEFSDFAQKNQNKDIVNAENELGIRDSRNPRLELLKTAFERFKKNDAPELNQLHKEFNTYKNDPIEAKRMGKISLYDFLAYKEDLFSETFDKIEREKLITETKQNHADDIEFFKFWQFLADNHHEKSRELLKKEGLELVGDCPFAFSAAEKWSTPDAFRKETRWGASMLDYNKMFNPDGTTAIAGEQLKEKLDFFFKRYDKIRFDVACDFVESQVIVHPKEPEKVIEFIENTAKKYYGKDFNKKLGYELFTSDLDYNRDLKKAFEKRLKIITQNTPDSLKKNDYALNNCQIGISNHDIPSAIDQFKNQDPYFLKNKPGADAFGINDSKDIIKFHFGEFFNAPNKFIFFKDFFGQDGVFNHMDTNNPKSFRQKLSPNYEEDYHKALQNGNGFNLMESLGIAMKTQGLDQSEKKLYEEVLKQSKILREKGATTQAEADKIQKNKDRKKILLIATAISAMVTSAIFIKNKKTKTEQATQDKSSLQSQHRHSRMA